MTNRAMLSALRGEMILRRVNPENSYLLNNGNAYVSNYKYSTLWQRTTTQLAHLPPYHPQTFALRACRAIN